MLTGILREGGFSYPRSPGKTAPHCSLASIGPKLGKRCPTTPLTPRTIQAHPTTRPLIFEASASFSYSTDPLSKATEAIELINHCALQIHILVSVPDGVIWYCYTSRGSFPLPGIAKRVRITLVYLFTDSLGFWRPGPRPQAHEILRHKVGGSPASSPWPFDPSILTCGAASRQTTKVPLRRPCPLLDSESAEKKACIAQDRRQNCEIASLATTHTASWHYQNLQAPFKARCRPLLQRTMLNKLHSRQTTPMPK